MRLSRPRTPCVSRHTSSALESSGSQGPRAGTPTSNRGPNLRLPRCENSQKSFTNVGLLSRTAIPNGYFGIATVLARKRKITCPNLSLKWCSMARIIADRLPCSFGSRHANPRRRQTLYPRCERSCFDSIERLQVVRKARAGKPYALLLRSNCRGSFDPNPTSTPPLSAAHTTVPTTIAITSPR
jgi:hypothetical protein